MGKRRGQRFASAMPSTKGEKLAIASIKRVLDPAGFTYTLKRGTRHLLMNIHTPTGQYGGRLTISGTPRMAVDTLADNLRQQAAKIVREAAHAIVL